MGSKNGPAGRAGRAAGLTSIEVPEVSDAGVLMWGRVVAGTASLAAWGAARPSRSRWLVGCAGGLVPPCSPPTSAQGRWVSTTGVRHRRDPLWVGRVLHRRLVRRWTAVGGALLGAAAGWATWWMFLFVARRRIVGRPVNVADPEVMSLVVLLAETSRRAAGLDFPNPNLDVA